MSLADFIQKTSLSSNPIEAAVSDNYRFDERLSQERKEVFEKLVYSNSANTTSICWEDFSAAVKLYLDGNYRVPQLSTPDAFLAPNSKAWLVGLHPNQSLVRLESLLTPLKEQDLTLESLQELIDAAESGSPDAIRAVDYFLDAWNDSRDGRPSFTAFYDEVIDEADNSEWPNMLRDRLGLGHYNPRDGI